MAINGDSAFPISTTFFGNMSDSNNSFLPTNFYQPINFSICQETLDDILNDWFFDTEPTSSPPSAQNHNALLLLGVG